MGRVGVSKSKQTMAILEACSLHVLIIVSQIRVVKVEILLRSTWRPVPVSFQILHIMVQKLRLEKLLLLQQTLLQHSLLEKRKRRLTCQWLQETNQFLGNRKSVWLFSFNIFKTQTDTGFGTGFTDEARKAMKGRLQKKLFGIGVMGPAFLGGAGFGFGAGLLSYSILHRYFYMRKIMFERKWIEDWDKQYYDNFYERWVVV